MDRAGRKTRDIQFYSQKNNAMVCVHSHWARDYAKWLETQPWVKSYHTCEALDKERFQHICPVGIRNVYFQTDWVSDFLLDYADGRMGVRELVTASGLQKQAAIEKLEFSRRYWAARDIADWKVLLVEDLT